MRKNVIFLLLFAPAIIVAQIKGKNSKNPYKSELGTTYKKGDKITLATATGSKYAYVYTFKSGFSVGNIMKTAKNLNDARSMNLTDVGGIKQTIKTTKSLAKDDLLKTSIKSLRSKVVSDKYVEENALASSMEGNTYTIKSFKIFTDDATGKQVVHAIAKGKKGEIAVLLDSAEEEGEI